MSPLYAPQRTCAHCEYYDGGGLDKNYMPKNQHGDCHNPRSGRFQTYAHETCHAFYPDTGRYASGLVLEGGRR
jgi:hypothetical protein